VSLHWRLLFAFRAPQPPTPPPIGVVYMPTASLFRWLSLFSGLWIGFFLFLHFFRACYLFRNKFVVFITLYSTFLLLLLLLLLFLQLF
jgi:hypothetical protein